MRHLRLIYLGLGIVLLVLVFRETDPAALWDQLTRVGALGFLVVVSIYLVAFLADAIGWHLALVPVRLTPAWLGRLFLVRLVGEAFNTITPLAGMGGEPVKAVLLKRRFAIPYRSSGASLLITKTINLLALVVFLGGGFYLLSGDERLPAAFTAAAAAGLAALGSGVGLFFLAQRYRISSRLGQRFTRARAGRRLQRALAVIEDIDDRLVGFYTVHRWRFGAALFLGLANWLLGIVELYYATRFLGHPISLTDAWIMEGAVQLVRAGAFFIPAGIGAQEGTFMLVSSALTGDPTLGVAVALVRRSREAFMVFIGIVAGWLASLRPGPAQRSQADAGFGIDPAKRVARSAEESSPPS